MKNSHRVLSESFQPRYLRRLLNLALILTFSTSITHAQTKPSNNGTKESAVQTSSSAGTGQEDSQAQDATAEGKAPDRIIALRARIKDAKTDSERARLQHLLIDYLVALNRKSEAIDELRAWAREDRVDPIGFYNLGNALARLGDTDAAIEAYRKAIKQRRGSYSHALNNLGVMLLREGRWDEAQEALQSALKLENSHYGEASYNLGRLYAARGEMDIAMREWTRALQAQPDHSDAAIALARALAEDGSPERGVAVLDAFLARRASNTEVADARREILFNSGEKEAAKSDGGNSASTTSRSLALDKETYDLLSRARAARADGRNEDAATLYRRVLSRRDGFFAPANLELGFALSSLKRYDEAAAMFETLVAREGARYPIAYYHLGRQYEALGKLDLAAAAFEKAVAAFDETNPQFLLDLSRVREKQGNFKAALAVMENYVRISQELGHVPEWTTERLAELRQKAESKE